MFTNQEIQLIITLLDAGVKTAGLQVFQNSGGIALQNVIEKLQDQLDENERIATSPVKGGEK